MKQLEIYRSIKEFFKKGIEHAEVETAKKLISHDLDSRDYFFAQAPTEWINWLQQNGFFQVLNQEAEDKTKYSYRNPELLFLIKASNEEEHQDAVVSVMKDIDCKSNFNPEVVDRFIQITGELDAEHISQLTLKMKQENWVKLMGDFKPNGHSYKAAVEKLAEAKAYSALVNLLEMFLTTPEEINQETYPVQYFYLNYIHETGILEALEDAPMEIAKRGVETLSKLFTAFTKPQEEDILDHEDVYYFEDVDFYSINLHRQRRPNSREDIKDMFKLFIWFIQKVMKSEDSKGIYASNLKPLPNSQNLWRIKLFAMGLQPEQFAEEIETELFKLFSIKHYSRLLYGTTYQQVLKTVFPTWKNEKQREYVAELFNLIMTWLKEKPDQKWHKKNGWEILSVITESLTKEEVEESERTFGEKPDASFEPEVFESEVRGGSVNDQSPVDFDSPQFEDIEAILKALKTDLQPDILKEKYKGDDFLRPRNAEGVGSALKNNMKSSPERMEAYLAKADEFLDDEIHMHYTYSFLRGVEDYLRSENKVSAPGWNKLFELFEKIKNKQNTPEEESDDRWLARWDWLEKVTADVLKFFLSKDYAEQFSSKRDHALEIIAYLLKSNDPTPERESEGSGDLFTIAINAVRGVAFQALVNFIYQDGKELQPDVLALYQETVKTSSLSVRFLLGHYLASFYYRNQEEVQKLFGEIFPIEDDRYVEFCAAWEGYIANTLYAELFEELGNLYEYALGKDSSDYPKRNRYFRELDEGLGTHLALAFAHFENVQYNQEEKHPLIVQLFEKSDIKKQKEFISFLGRGPISREHPDHSLSPEQIQKLKVFWEYILSENREAELYASFGMWINHKKDIFDYKWLAHIVAETLEKSEGRLDWDYGLTRRLEKFLEVNPEDTLTILEKHLIGGVLENPDKNWFYLDNKMRAVFESLYEKLPKETEELINKLCEKGRRRFWPLLEIIGIQ